jgi:hypothetical protein
MAKRRGRKPQSIPMKIGNDPALWRYASVQEALEANTHLLARLIQAGAEVAGGTREPDAVHHARQSVGEPVY